MRKSQLATKSRTAFIDLRHEDRFRTPQVCVLCGGRSRVDWIDLVKLTASHTCRDCDHRWTDSSGIAPASLPTIPRR